MKKYCIVFGKDPEFIPTTYWPDMYEDSEEFKNNYVSGIFETDEEEMFWNMMTRIRLLPPSMWYWVMIDGVQWVSGAIAPEDIYEVFEDIVPEWVYKDIELLDKCFNTAKFYKGLSASR